MASEALTASLTRPDLMGCVMDAELQSELNDLRFHWDERYEIAYDDKTREWSARFKDADYAMTGRTSDELMAYAHLRERSST